MGKVAARATRLSKRTVDGAATEADRYILWDTELTGFGLRVAPSGVKTFIARYRVGGGRTGTLRQQVVGRYGKVTPEEARADAKVILNAAARGLDPQAKKAERRAAMTVGELCDLYQAEGAPTRKPSTVSGDGSRIKWHIKPVIGFIKLPNVERRDIDRMVREIATGGIKTDDDAHVRGGRPSATRTLALVRSIFAFAVGRGLLDANPAKGVKSFKPVKRERFLSAKEMAALGDALTTMAAEGRFTHALPILRLLALTGARRNEIARLTWAEVDQGRALLRLNDSKTGQKVVPLGAAALSVLAEVTKTNSPYVFPQPGEPEKPFRGLMYVWSIVRTRAGLDGVRIHDLRHSFASAGLASGQGLPLIGKLLGHAQVATTARYAHLADDPVKAAADRISEHIAGAMGGKSALVKDLKGAS